MAHTLLKMRTWDRLLPLLAVLGLALTAGVGNGEEERETYTWIDENGQRVYSDRPPPAGTEGVRLDIDVPSPPSDPFAGLRSEEPASTPADDQPPAEPVSVTIVRPAPEETYVNTSYRVQVGVDVQPRLPRGGRVQLYLDGALAATGAPGQQSFVLEQVYRGEHTVAAAAIDADGRELDRSLPVTFFVRQASIISPP